MYLSLSPYCRVNQNLATTLFLFFYWLLPSLCHLLGNSCSCCYPSCSNPGESGCALARHRKAHNTAGAMAVGHPVTRGWAARSVPLTPVAKTCTDLGVQPFRPDALASSRPCPMTPQTLVACVWLADHSSTSDDNVWCDREHRTS
jgi:hypothetical protein